MKYGIYTLILQSHFFKSTPIFHFECGWGNGYVFLPRNHPFYGKDYDELNIDVHGSLTFGEKFKSSYFHQWIEDKEYYGDVNLDNYLKLNEYWVIGFDTAHSGDSLLSCPKEYVISQTESMLEQCLSDDIFKIQKYKSVYSRKDKLKKISQINPILKK
jgi:hypothetical protein